MLVSLFVLFLCVLDKFQLMHQNNGGGLFLEENGEMNDVHSCEIVLFCSVARSQLPIYNTHFVWGAPNSSLFPQESLCEK